MTSIKKINELHSEAMKLAEKAEAFQTKGKESKAIALFHQAFELEKSAALAVATEYNNEEPSRSVLLRSAASLALDCQEFREAERLISIGLGGNPPEELADELRDLLESVYFSRHLSLRGLTLDKSAFQMSLDGNSVGNGLIESTEYKGRLDKLERIIVRTIERTSGLPFRETGGPSKAVMKNLEILYSTPRAASYAITVKIGRPKGQRLLNFSDSIQPKTVVDEVLTCIDQFSSDHVDALESRIANDAYFENFTALAKGLAPDGHKIKLVGFTSSEGPNVRTVALTKPASPIWNRRERSNVPSRTEQFIGRISFVDETRGKTAPSIIQLRAEDNTLSDKIRVSVGLIQDIVKPHYGDLVRVYAVREQGHLVFENIEPIDSDVKDPVPVEESVKPF